MPNLFDGQAFSQELREAMGDMTIRELADKAGVDKGSVHRVIQRGSMPSVETYLRLCAWLSMETVSFIDKTSDTC